MVTKLNIIQNGKSASFDIEENADGIFILASDYEALKAERDAQQKRDDALLAEGAGMREALDNIRIFSSDTLSGPSDSVPDMAAWLREGVEYLHHISNIETPATSAALAAIEARAKAEAFEEIIEFIDHHSGISEMKTQWDLSSSIVAHIDELREAK